jgi:hypothetical protein
MNRHTPHQRRKKTPQVPAQTPMAISAVVKRAQHATVTAALPAPLLQDAALRTEAAIPTTVACPAATMTHAPPSRQRLRHRSHHGSLCRCLHRSPLRHREPTLHRSAGVSFHCPPLCLCKCNCNLASQCGSEPPRAAHADRGAARMLRRHCATAGSDAEGGDGGGGAACGGAAARVSEAQIAARAPRSLAHHDAACMSCKR